MSTTEHTDNNTKGDHMKQQALIVPAVVGIVALAGGFLGGMKYQQSKTPFMMNQQFGAFQGGMGMMGKNIQGGNGQRIRMGGNGMQAIRGEVIDQDDKSITVKMPDGSSKVILFTGSTTFSKATTATNTDVKKGDAIVIFGSTNTDGSVAANTVQLNPENFRLPNASATPAPKQ